MKNILVICSLIVLFFGCSQNNVNEFDKFLNEYYLESFEVKTPLQQNMIGELVLLDSVLVAMDLQGNYIFHVFKFPEIVYIDSEIRRGHGPNEEFFVNPYFRKIYKNKFMYQNTNSIQIAHFDIDSSKIVFEKKINLPGKLMNLQSPFIIDDLVIGWEQNAQTDKEFLSYNPNRIIKVDTFGVENIDIGHKISSPKFKFIYAKIESVKPDKSLFAVTYDKFPILRIYDKNGNLISERRFNNGQKFPKELLKKKPNASKLKKITQNYRKIKTTDMYIYSLYIGKTNDELGIEGSGIDDFTNEIHVWDWEGNPIARILLDKKIFSFEVTPDDKYFICSSLKSMDAFYKYTLPWKN